MPTFNGMDQATASLIKNLSGANCKNAWSGRHLKGGIRQRWGHPTTATEVTKPFAMRLARRSLGSPDPTRNDKRQLAMAISREICGTQVCATSLTKVREELALSPISRTALAFMHTLAPLPSSAQNSRRQIALY